MTKDKISMHEYAVTAFVAGAMIAIFIKIIFL
jgi:hypothetical protein